MKPLKIIICIKQVPGTTQVEIDDETGNLKRAGIESKMNMYDLFSIETALSLTDKLGGETRVLTMGPPQAEAVLREAVYMGADAGTLVSDFRFAGSDVLATAYTLSQAVRHMGEYDLILCGKQTTDGDTAQVGSELAEFLDIPHASGVTSIEPDAEGGVTSIAPIDKGGVTSVAPIDKGGVTVCLSRDDYIVRQYMPTPCLLCMDGDINTPRLPSYKRKRDLPEGYLSTLTLDDLSDKDETHYGLKGSPTQVEAIFPPEKSSGQEIITGTGEEVGAKLAQILIEKKMIEWSHLT